MELKKALGVCLISLFSATLVLLIARALDLQAASRLEPQLAAIVEELQTLRKQGGIAAVSGAAAESGLLGDGLVVYYFHRNFRCPTCRAIESQSRETVHSEFASQLDSGEMVWKILNYETPAGEGLAEQFKIISPVVVLAKMKSGQIEQWNRLDQVWALVGDKPAFAEYVRDEISQMLETGQQQLTTVPGGDVPPLPVFDVGPGVIPAAETGKEDQAMDGQGQITAAPGSEAAGKPLDRHVAVYYFHAAERCETCRRIESQSNEVVQGDFAAHLDAGRVVWKTVGYEDPAMEGLVKQFQVVSPGVVLAKVNGGQVETWKTLDQVWTLVGDPPGFGQYVRNEILQMLQPTGEPPDPSVPQ